MDVKKYKEEVASIDWTYLMENTDIDIISDIFVNKLLDVLNCWAPLKNFQKRRKKQKNWVMDKMKLEMGSRDSLRDKARISGCREDWDHYRAARNACVKNLSVKCKEEYFQNVYRKI